MSARHTPHQVTRKGVVGKLSIVWDDEQFLLPKAADVTLNTRLHSDGVVRPLHWTKRLKDLHSREHTAWHKNDKMDRGKES